VQEAKLPPASGDMPKLEAMVNAVENGDTLMVLDVSSSAQPVSG